MNDNQTIEIVKYIFSLITSKYDFLNRILSLRKYLNWRSKVVKQMRLIIITSPGLRNRGKKAVSLQYQDK